MPSNFLSSFRLLISVVLRKRTFPKGRDQLKHYHFQYYWWVPENIDIFNWAQLMKVVYTDNWNSTEIIQYRFHSFINLGEYLLQTMDISSIMINLKHNNLLHSLFSIPNDNLGISPPNSVTGKANAECSVIPWILCAASAVGAASYTLIASGFVLGNELICLIKPSFNALITVLYQLKDLIQCATTSEVVDWF